MTTSDGVTRKPSWATIGWLMLGLLALFVGVLRYQLTEEAVRLWWYSDRYVSAELEVTRLQSIRSRRTTVGHRIGGVIHPGGEAVVADSRNAIALDDRTGRGVPASDLVVGQRLAVLYWPNHTDVKRSWHPPTVVRPGAIPRGEVVVRVVLSWVAFGAVVVFSFWRVVRIYRSSVRAESGRTDNQYPSTWFGITLVLCYLGAIGLMAYLMSS